MIIIIQQLHQLDTNLFQPIIVMGYHSGFVIHTEGVCGSCFVGTDDKDYILDEMHILIKEQLKDSLATYDMKTAIELNDRLEQLKTERDNRNAEIDAHNKEIDKKIANYAEELSKTEDGKAIVDLIQGRSGKYAVELKKAIIRYFSSIPAKQARKELDEGKYAHLMDKATYNTINDYITYVLQNA